MNHFAYDLAEKLSAKFAEPTEKSHNHVYEFTVDPSGRKYQRIICTPVFQGRSTGRHVYCFVDGDGNVFKAAGWKAPAKHVRFTVDTSEKLAEFIQVADPHGSCLYIR